MGRTLKPSELVKAVLLMAHGGPDSLLDIEPFLGHIMRHRTPTPPSPELVATVRSRYEQIGGRSPLLDITLRQAAALEAVLNAKTSEFRVYVGMRHWAPFIHETVRQIISDRPQQLVAISMAPQYSRMSVGAYIQAAQDALVREGGDEGRSLSAAFVTHWHDQPLLLDAFSKKIKEGLGRYSPDDRANCFLLFTAHSLPEAILVDKDLYPAHLAKTVDGIVSRLGSLISPDQWAFAYQSQGMSGGKWLGPDVVEVLDKIAPTRKNVLIAPIGFVADHVEILYDLDIYYREIAAKKGIVLQRIESLNDTPLMISALAAVVRAHTLA